MNELTFHPGGIAIAVAFAITMSSLVWWMLHPPAQVEAVVAKALRGVAAIRRILVPVRGDAHNMRAVELACRLGFDQRAEILACHVVVVPLSLPLSTSLPGEEQAAAGALDKAEEIIHYHGLVTRREIVRERDVARGVLRVAEGAQVDMVVLGINPRNLAAGESVGQATEQLLRRSHIEVIVDMHPEPEIEVKS